MDARRAYEALILGELTRSYRSSYAQIRSRVITSADPDLIRDGILTRTDERLLAEAREYADACCERAEGDPKRFESIYDLLLFYERIDLTWPESNGGRGSDIYRGQSDSRWSLVPSLFRFGDQKPDSIRFRTQALRVLEWAHELGLILTPLDTLAILQHYDQRTSLLDFTRSARIASAFACRGYNPSDGPEYGVIYIVNMADCEDYVGTGGTALGCQYAFEVPHVPRIELQQGLFFGGFKSPALEHLGRISRHEFRHGPHSQDFCSVTGLVNEVLFPPTDELAVRLAGQRVVDHASPAMVAIADKALALLESHWIRWKKPFTWRDYFELAQSWRNEIAIGKDKEHELLVLARWFWLIQSTDLPLLCKSLHVLWGGVQALQIDRHTCADDATDIEGRLMASRACEAEGLVRLLFKRARADVDMGIE